MICGALDYADRCAHALRFLSVGGHLPRIPTSTAQHNRGVLLAAARVPAHSPRRKVCWSSICDRRAGSPELDRTRVAVERAEPDAAATAVDLTVSPLVADRVYLIGARGVRSVTGEAPVHPQGAYTLNQVPAR